MSTSRPPINKRLRIVKHKGHVIYIIDFSHCAAKEILLLLDLVRADIARHAPGSLLTLADFTEAQIDKAVATRMKELLALDRPYVKKSAWVGTESMPHVLYEHFKNFSQRDFPLFNTQEAAMDWLVEGESLSEALRPLPNKDERHLLVKFSCSSTTITRPFRDMIEVTFCDLK